MSIIFKLVFLYTNIFKNIYCWCILELHQKYNSNVYLNICPFNKREFFTITFCHKLLNYFYVSVKWACWNKQVSMYFGMHLDNNDILPIFMLFAVYLVKLILRHFIGMKVRKRAKIRNRHNQAPHPTQDTNGKVTTSQPDITNESKEVIPFPAGDPKAPTNRRARKHNKTREK